jgi:hypothetical protein
MLMLLLLLLLLLRLELGLIRSTRRRAPALCVDGLNWLDWQFDIGNRGSLLLIFLVIDSHPNRSGCKVIV